MLAPHPGALVVRTSAFFGPWDEHNFVRPALRALRGGPAVRGRRRRDRLADLRPRPGPRLRSTC